MYLRIMNRIVLSVLVIFYAISNVHSQPQIPGNEGNMDDTTIPVDGGIITVIGSAMVYGFYKNRKQKP